MFQEFLNQILKISKSGNFQEQTYKVSEIVNSYTDDDIKKIVKDIGTIPECIKASSSEEKLFSKTSDIILSKCFNILGLKSNAIKERADSADVIAVSNFHKYSLVADAKCFRMSRTAKNQKDFKVGALSNWRGTENEYAVLVSPFFQYPKEESQIYKTALDENVCLFSWEHLSILLEHNIKETENFSLESIWNSSKMFARETKIPNAKSCFLPKIHEIVAKKIGISREDFLKLLNFYRLEIISRGGHEIDYCQSKIEEINMLTRVEAIKQLIKETKLEERIKVITHYILTVKEKIDE